jgi:hypothetical protein
MIGGIAWQRSSAEQRVGSLDLAQLPTQIPVDVLDSWRSLPRLALLRRDDRLP